MLTIERDAETWVVDGERHDRVTLACTASEAARLLADLAPKWSAIAAALTYEPIVTVWLRCPTARWNAPMLSFPQTSVASPVPAAQFGFDLGQLGGSDGLFAFVISGARPWLDRGLPACADAVLTQWRDAFGSGGEVRVVTARAQRRATFACVPGLLRPEANPLPGLSVAGDYVAGPYPATLEGAVRSGLAAVN